MRIFLLPACNGDCILVEYEALHYILIDGGYADTYRKYLSPMLRNIAKQGGILDLLVVTHIDSDHISGIIKLLEETDHPIPIKQVWYNGYRHIQSPVTESTTEELFVHHSIVKDTEEMSDKPVSVKQGCTLSSLINKRRIGWNTLMNGDAIVAPVTVTLNSVKIHILSPKTEKIELLKEFWTKRLIKDNLLSKAHSEEYWDDAYEFSLSKEKPGFHFRNKRVSWVNDLKKIRETQYIPDGSVTNGSSIAFVLESCSKKVLFAGDAHAETILESLKAIYGGGNRLYRFDAIKVSHHGSFENNSPEFLSAVSSDKWIISTNGEKYNHPDLATLANIITNHSKEDIKLYFNYDLPVCTQLLKPEVSNGYSYQILTPDNKGIHIIEI